MIDPHPLSRPAPYGEGRILGPIQVIEGWGLCHHLACVINYIALFNHRARRKNPVWQDLCKAEWYLLREINARKPCMWTYPVPGADPVAPEAIAEDWGLPARLGAVVFYITTYQKLYFRLPLMRIVCLKQALAHLRSEIRLHEFQEVFLLDGWCKPTGEAKTLLLKDPDNPNGKE